MSLYRVVLERTVRQRMVCEIVAESRDEAEAAAELGSSSWPDWVTDDVEETSVESVERIT